MKRHFSAEEISRRASMTVDFRREREDNAGDLGRPAEAAPQQMEGSMPEQSQVPDNLIPFPTDSIRKLGYKRARKRINRLMESEGQLRLFDEQMAEVVSIPSGITPFDEALLLDERGDPRAADYYSRAIDLGDNPADAYCNLGILRTRSADRIAAFRCFSKAVTNDPLHFEAHYNLGNIYFEEGDFRLAKLHYEVAADIDPEHPNAWFNLGLVEVMADDLDAAVRALTTYKNLVSGDECDQADELLRTIAESIARDRTS